MTEQETTTSPGKPFPWRIFITVCLVLLAMVGGAIVTQYGAAPKDDYDSGLPVEKVVVHMKNGDSHAFDLEVAQRPIDLEIGLMYRRQMDPDHGMLFEMGTDPQVTRFWMKNTYLPLDMLFVDKHGKIVTLHANAVPLSTTGISSEKPVTAVIEINGGRAAALGIKPGDTVEHKYFQ